MLNFALHIKQDEKVHFSERDLFFKVSVFKQRENTPKRYSTGVI